MDRQIEVAEQQRIRWESLAGQADAAIGAAVVVAVAGLAAGTWMVAVGGVQAEVEGFEVVYEMRPLGVLVILVALFGGLIGSLGSSAVKVWALTNAGR